jgi:branched-chain amino acid transport system substrate-binding protein
MKFLYNKFSPSSTFTCVLFFAILLSSGCSSSDPYIAVIGNDESSFGRQIRAAADYAREEISGGIQVKYFDDDGEQVEARRIALDLVSDPNLIAVVGHATSSTTKAGQEIYTRYDIPLFAPVATYSGLTLGRQGDENSLARRLVPSNNQQAAQVGTLVERLKEIGTINSNRVILIYEIGAYGTDLQQSIASILQSRNYVVEKFPIGKGTNIKSVSPLISSRLSSNTNIATVIFAGYSNMAKVVVKSVTGNVPGKPIILTDGSFDDNLLTEPLGLKRSNVYITFVAPDWRKIISSKVSGNGWDARKVERFEKEYNNYPNTPKEIGFAPFAVDGISMVVNHVNNFVNTEDAEEMRERLTESINDTSVVHNGLLRDYKFTLDGEAQNTKGHIYTISGTGPPTYSFENIKVDSVKVK